MKTTFNKFRFIISLGLVLTVIISIGCKKTEDFKNLDLLIKKDWKLSSITMNDIEVADSCDLDDVLTFDDASTFGYYYGSEWCDDDIDPRNIHAKGWKMRDDFTVIILKYRIDPDQGIGYADIQEWWEITELNASTLILKDASAEDNDQIPEYRTFKY